MNEGHSALLTLALLEQRLEGRGLSSATEEDLHAVRNKCVFTTHTPVAAGQDQFPRNLVGEVLGEPRAAALEAQGACRDGSLNMTYLALYGSRYINGVAIQHGEVSRSMFPRYPVRAITNGVHAVTWTASAFRELYDQHIPEWRHDNLYLRYAIGVAANEIRAAHARAKLGLLRELRERTGVVLDEKVMTIGFARRAASYKRADLLFRKDAVRVVYIENYDWGLAPLLYAGVDLWLALNGVPSFSVMDGWWVEGCLEGITGWAIGHGPESPDDEALEVASLHDKLEMIILPMFYGRPSAYAEVMRSAIAINGSFLNTQRMLSQYVANDYSQEATP